MEVCENIHFDGIFIFSRYFTVLLGVCLLSSPFENFSVRFSRHERKSAENTRLAVLLGGEQQVSKHPCKRILSDPPRESPPYDRTNRASTLPKAASRMARMSWHAYARPLKDEAGNQWRITASDSTKASRRYVYNGWTEKKREEKAPLGALPHPRKTTSCYFRRIDFLTERGNIKMHK